MTILRGRLIRDFTTPELIALYRQLDADLAEDLDQLDAQGKIKFTELGLIEDELQARQ